MAVTINATQLAVNRRDEFMVVSVSSDGFVSVHIATARRVQSGSEPPATALAFLTRWDV
jgi:hypothetical protein